MLMPFGKHKGLEVEDLPDSYLQWLYETVDLLDPLRTAIYNEVARRSGEAMALVDNALLRQVFRQLALKWHPDRGGSHEAMAALNEMVELLKAGGFS